MSEPPRPADKLSEPAKTALRLIFERRLGVGELAAALDEPHDTVKARLATARRILGATSTRQAARLLAEHEGRLHPFGVNPEGAIGSTAEAAIVGASSAACSEREGADERQCDGGAEFDRAGTQGPGSDGDDAPPTPGSEPSEPRLPGFGDAGDEPAPGVHRPLPPAADARPWWEQPNRLGLSAWIAWTLGLSVTFMVLLLVAVSILRSGMELLPR